MICKLSPAFKKGLILFSLIYCVTQKVRKDFNYSIDMQKFKYFFVYTCISYLKITI